MTLINSNGAEADNIFNIDVGILPPRSMWDTIVTVHGEALYVQGVPHYLYVFLLTYLHW